MNFDPATIPNAWPKSGPFTIPDWESIDQWVDAHHPKQEKWDEIYTVLCRHWMAKLRDELGGDYHIVKSHNWHLLTSQDNSSAQTVLNALEQTTAEIVREWDGVASGEGYGPHMALVFDEADDYYEYIGQYFPGEGEEVGASAGMMLDRGYSHIVIGNSDMLLAAPTLFHELTHMLVSHLPLPLWINEGLATSAERVLSGYQQPLLDTELAHEHRWYWNENNIQEFWNGDSFHKPGRAQKLSYSLAEVLANHLRSMPGYRDFILNASWEDAGEAAAQEHLGCSVGDVVSIFLGDGNWRVKWIDMPQDEEVG